jgi:hypothetical protein
MQPKEWHGQQGIRRTCKLAVDPAAMSWSRINLSYEKCLQVWGNASLGFSTSTSPSFTQHPRRSILDGFKGFSCDLSIGQIPGTLISGFAYHGLDVLHQKEQVKRVRWAGFKLPMEIPLPGRLVLGVNQQCTNPSNIRRLRCAQQRIF